MNVPSLDQRTPASPPVHLLALERARRKAGPPPRLRGDRGALEAACEHLLLAAPPTSWDTYASVSALVGMADATYRAEGRAPLTAAEWREVAHWLARADVLMAWGWTTAGGYSRSLEVA